MIDKLSSFASQLVYLFTHLTLANVVDIALVATVFFVVLQALRQTRSLSLLRGAITFSILAAVLLVILPLDTFNWLLRVTLLAGAVAWPMIFQDELRQALTGLGQVGQLRRGRGSGYNRFKGAIITATTRLASRHQGALIVLEAQTPLADIIATGIPIQATRLTAELLESLFQPKSPLHDGAVVLRGDRLVAASCILPVQTGGTGDTHLGTRHRAALGLSSHIPDALVVVVSEETGRISVAQKGRLHQALSGVELDDWLERFHEQLAGKPGSGWQKFGAALAGWLRGTSLKSTLGSLLLAVVLALFAWVSVVYQTNPPQQITVANVPLTINAQSPDLISMQALPGAVSVQVQTTRGQAEGMNANSIRAEADLVELADGVHRVGIEVALADERAQVVSISPQFVDVVLEPLATRTLTPTLTTSGVDALPPGYILDTISPAPETVSVQGAQSLVDQVAAARVTLALNGRRTGFQQAVPVELLDSGGEPLTTLQPTPDSLLVTVSITRTFDTRQVPVQANLAVGDLERGYQVTAVRISPPEVTLAGQQNALEKAGDFVSTAPISLTGVFDHLVSDVPLILPEGVSALNRLGEPVTGVVARVTVSPAAGYLALSKVPTVSGVPSSLSARLSPKSVTVLLVGPEPLLAQVDQDKNLVLVSLSLANLEPGSYLLPLVVQAPEGLRAETFPAEVEVTLAEEEPEAPPLEVE